jgi:predicted DNA-binding protein
MVKKQSKIKELKLSPGVEDEVDALAKRAAKTDSWMRPVVESGDDLEDFGQFAMAHRGQWESTSQYQCLWGAEITKIIDREIEAGVGKDFSEPRIALLEELTGMFWEAWEGYAKLYEAWEKYRKRNKPKKRK